MRARAEVLLTHVSLGKVLWHACLGIRSSNDNKPCSLKLHNVVQRYLEITKVVPEPVFYRTIAGGMQQ
jgi:hypothetical protein